MAQYKPLSLLQTRTYPGYQFYAVMKYDGQPPEQCMKYIILTFFEWLRQKVSSENLPEELVMPAARDFVRVEDAQFQSYHFSGGFSLDVTSLLQHGIWAARIKEPDLERNGKKAVVGRFFVTELGLHCLEDGVECGVRIDVLDPVNVTEEVPYAFRPAFMRRLFETKKLRIRQVDLLRYDEAQHIGTYSALSRFIELIHSPDNYMPVIVLTHAVQSRNVKEILEKIDSKLGLTDMPGSFLERLKQIDLAPDTLEIGDPVLPYDANYMAYHTFGYARVYTLDEKLLPLFKKKVNQPGLNPGDLLWIPPYIFGEECTVLAYDAHATAGVREAGRNRIIDQAHSYSKHKNYPFGSVVFEASARRLEVEERIKAQLQKLRTSEQANAEQRIEEIYEDTEKLIALYEEEKKRSDEENQQLQEENQKQRGKIEVLEDRCRRAEAAAKARGGVVIQTPDTEEFFEDEMRDLVLSILMDAKKSYCTEGTRAADLLDSILGQNELTGEGIKLFERLKNILYRNNNVTEGDKSDLRELGFDITKRQNNHIMLIFKGNAKYSEILPSTASDYRSLRNACSSLLKKVSIYK